VLTQEFTEDSVRQTVTHAAGHPTPDCTIARPASRSYQPDAWALLVVTRSANLSAVFLFIGIK
jgi:hypothetical protein